MNNIETLVNYFVYLMIGIGIMAFLVSVVVQVIKDIPNLNLVPTSLVTLIVSLIICTASVIFTCGFFGMKLSPQIVFAAIVVSFIVYLIATGGWERVKSIWDRTKYPGGSK